MTMKSSVMTRADYERYLELFMKSDPAWKEYYAAGAVMMFPAADGSMTNLEGPEAIDAMFKGIHSIVDETADVIWFVADEHAAVAMIRGKFVVKKDAYFTGKAVKTDQVMRQQGVMYYTMENGKIKHVSMLPPQVLNDFRAE
jgi:hypothetical protein